MKSRGNDQADSVVSAVISNDRKIETEQHAFAYIAIYQLVDDDGNELYDLLHAW